MPTDSLLPADWFHAFPGQLRQPMTSMHTRTRRLARWFALPLEEVVAGVSLVVVVGAVLWGVLTRYLFPQPAAWTYEVATIGFAWLVFFGAAAGVRYRLHSDIDILVVSFSPRWQHLVAVFNFWLLAFFFAALCIFSVLHTLDAHKSLTIALNVPRSVIYAPLGIAALMMLARHIEAWFNRNDPDADGHEANIT